MVSRSFSIDAMSSRTARRRRRLRRAAVAAVAVVVIASGVGVTATALSRGSSVAYSTATVTTRDLQSTVSGVAAIEPVSQASVAFPTAGTVATVDATVGATVTAGQALATLDATSLQVALNEKEQALTQAQLILSKALDGEDVSALVGGGGGGFGMTHAVTTLTSVHQATFTLVAADRSGDITAAQQAVLAGQSRVDQARSSAAATLDTATSICAAVGVDIDPEDPSATTSSIQACQSALQDVVAAQSSVQNAQDDLAAAASQLDDLLADYADELQSSATTTPTTDAPATTETTAPDGTTTTAPQETTTTTPQTDASAPSIDEGTVPVDRATPSGGGRSLPTGSVSGGVPTGGGGAGGTTVSSPSSEDLIAYQAAVDSAFAELISAQQALAQATIVSPIDGTVTVADLVAGEEVTAGSTAQRILVEGAGGYEASVSLSLAEIADVAIGQPAALVPDGSTTAIAGTVVAIGATPDPSASTTSYRVTIALTGDTSGLRNGALGTVAITTDSAQGVLAVPSSAITPDGNRHVVTVINGTTTTETTVDVGVVGATWTEITDGLNAGQHVAVADLNAPLPSAATSSSSSATTGGGRDRGGFQLPAGFTPPGN